MGKAEVYRFLWRRTPKNRARVYQKPGFPTALIRSHPKRAFGSGGFLAHILLSATIPKTSGGETSPVST
jgi:hypothetical protein